MMIDTLVDVCSGNDPGELRTLITKHINKNDDFNLKEILPVCSRKKQEELWDGLYSLMTQIFTQTPIMQDTEDEELEVAISSLQDILTIASCVLEQPKLIIPAKMLETITTLHELLLDFPDKAVKLQVGIARICQTWWVKEIEGREALVANTIMFLLVKSSQPNASNAAVKRVYSMRASLLQVDYNDESSTTLKDLLLRCVISPVFLKNDEGRRFLSFLFGLNLEFIESLHKTIKNQIPACPKHMAEWYGNVYFKAWKLASGPYVDKIEEHCIQDLMYHSMHASRVGARSMSTILRIILGCFHKQKVQQGVDKMLLKLYNPILWRSLKVANGTVRANSIALLVEAFPLQDPEQTNEERDDLLQKQFDVLSNLLYDPCVVVRTTCVIGICRILFVFWELIPLNTSEDLLTKLVQDHARDMSSTEVRATVYKGLTFVLDNHLSHVMMKRLLPQLGPLIHDTAEKVRVAFVELILKVKAVRSIKVSDVISMEHLLARLEIDSPPVVRRLVQLLFNSFQPLDKAGEVQLTRCIALVQTNNAAARVFYRYAHQHMSVDDAVKFLLLIGQCVFACVQRSTNYSDSETEKENEDDVLTLDDKDIVDGLLEVIVIIWTSIDHELTVSHSETRKKLVKRFTKAVPVFLDVFQGGRSLEAVLMLASFLPGSSMPDFRENCLTKLKRLGYDSSVKDFAPLLECLLSWRMGADVLDMINHRIKRVKPRYQNQKNLNERKKGKKLWSIDSTLLQDSMDTTVLNSDCSSQDSTIHKDDESKLEECKLSLWMLDWLLAQQTTRTFIMQANSEHLLQVLHTLKQLVEKIEINKCMEKDEEDIFEQVIYSYCKTTMHLQAEGNEDDMDMVGELLTSFITCINRDILSQPITSPSTSFRWIQCFLTICSEAFLVGQVKADIGKNIASFLAILLQKDPPLNLLTAIMLVLYHACLMLLTTDEQTREDDIVPLLMMHVIKLLARKIKDGKENIEKILPSLKPGLMAVLQCYHRNNPDNCQHILATIMAAIIAELTSAIEQDDQLKSSKAFSELPTLSGFLLTMVNSKPSILRCFVSELDECLRVGGIQGIYGILATLHVVYSVSKAGKNTHGLDECLLLLKQLIQPLKVKEVSESDEESIEKELIENAEIMVKELSQDMGLDV